MSESTLSSQQKKMLSSLQEKLKEVQSESNQLAQTLQSLQHISKQIEELSNQDSSDKATSLLSSL